MMRGSVGGPGRWLVIGWLALCGAPALAQEPVGGRDTLRLTLADAVARAIEQSEEIQAARAQFAQAQARVTQARAVALPQLSTSLTYNRAIRTIFDDFAAPPPADTTQIPSAFDEARTPYERYDTLSELLMDDFMSGLFAGLPFGRRNTYIALVQLSQPLFAGGRISGARRAARHLETAAGHQLEEAEADIVLQVRLAYLGAMLAQRLHAIAVQSRSTAGEHYQQVQAFREAGTASEFDLLRARVDLENREPLVIQAANGAGLALLELKRLVNLPIDRPVVLTSAIEPALAEIDSAEVARLVADRPLLRAAREGVAAREAGVKIAKADWFPAVHLVGNLGFQAYPGSMAPPGFSEWRKDWSVALAFSWVPFDGLGRSGRVNEAQAQLREARLQEAQLEEGLQVQVAAAVGDYRTAVAQVLARRETVKLAERTHELVELRYANGLATQLEVSDAALLLDQAQVNEVQALADYIRALAQVERLTGGRLTLLAERQP